MVTLTYFQDVCINVCWVLFFSFVQYQLNKDKMNFSTLRNIQGLHAPLKLQMEYRAARQVCLVKCDRLSSWEFPFSVVDV